MYKIYFKQAIQMLKQNKFMSIIAIIGTALAITMIMAIIVSEEMKSVSVDPEINRNKTYYIKYQMVHDSVAGHTSSGSLEYETINDYLYSLKTPQFTSASFEVYQGNTSIVNIPGVNNRFDLVVRGTDANYWHILSHTIQKGRTYTREEFESGVNYALLSKSTTKKIFMDQDALGKTIEISFKPYTIIGIVKDVSPLFTNAYSDIWIPYTSTNIYKNTSYLMMLMAHKTSDYAKIYAEVRDIEKKFGMDHTPKYLFLLGPYNQRIITSNEVWGRSEEEVQDKINILNRKLIFILIILLLVPAMNLSGLSLSRIKRRTSEIGVRKAFGAKKYIILIQVLYENFITSLIGGIIGLALSYIIIFWLRGWLLNIPENADIPFNATVSPFIFLAVFLVCILINLISAGIPAYRASKITIINSLNQNDKK